jgi:hypothetical protein
MREEKEFELRVFGVPKLFHLGKEVQGASKPCNISQESFRLLICVAIHEEVFVEGLLPMLWSAKAVRTGEVDKNRVYGIKNELSSIQAGLPKIIKSSREHDLRGLYQIDSARISTDYQHFKQYLHDHKLTEDGDFTPMVDALSLYDELLKGWPQNPEWQWLQKKRDEVKEIYQRALCDVGEWLKGRGRADLAYLLEGYRLGAAPLSKEMLIQLHAWQNSSHLQLPTPVIPVSPDLNPPEDLLKPGAQEKVLEKQVRKTDALPVVPVEEAPDVRGSIEDSIPLSTALAPKTAKRSQVSRRSRLMGIMLLALLLAGIFFGKRAWDQATYEQQIQQAHIVLGERTEKAIRDALQLYQEAQFDQPKRPEAYVGMATCQSLLRYYGFEKNYHYDKISRRKMPISLEPNALEPDVVGTWINQADEYSHDSIARCRLFTLKAWVDLVQWKMEEADSNFETALTLERNSHLPGSDRPYQYATLHQWLSLLEIIRNQYTGEFAESFTEIGRADGIAPNEAVIEKSLAQRFYYAKAYHTALRKLDAIVKEGIGRKDKENRTENRLVRYWLGLVYLQLGLREKNDEHLSKSRGELAAASKHTDMKQVDFVMWGAYIHACAIASQKKNRGQWLVDEGTNDAWKYLERQREQWVAWETGGEQGMKPRYVSPIALAIAAVGFSKATQEKFWKDKALKYLKDAEEERCSDLLFLQLEPRYGPIQKEDAFVKFREGMSSLMHLSNYSGIDIGVNGVPRKDTL